MKKLLLLAVLLPYFAFVPPTDHDVFVGDSITFGNELGPLQYTDRWSTQYCVSAPTDEINQARSGASMAANPYGRPVFTLNDVPDYEASFRHIFVSYWVNDFCYGTTPAAFAAATSAAVDGIMAKGWPAAKIVLCFNYMDASGAYWPYLTPAAAQQWLAALRSVQQAKSTSFLDFYTPISNRADKNTYSLDGIHPTAAWNAIMKQYAETNIEGPASTLPVSIVGFAGQRQGNANVLKWTVAQEKDVLRYQVDRSANGINWAKAGEVASLGNSAAQRSYSFTDNAAGSGRQIYRLRAVDMNGAVKLSNLIVVSGSKAAQLSLGGLFPNPAATKLNVVVNAPAKETVTLQVLDLAGRTVKAQRESVDAGANTLDVNLSALKAGSYLIRLASETTKTTAVERFLKQ